MGCPHWGMGGMRIMATNYTEIYIVGGNDGRIGLKYAILSTITQPTDNQSVITITKVFTFHD